MDYKKEIETLLNEIQSEKFLKFQHYINKTKTKIKSSKKIFPPHAGRFLMFNQILNLN